MNSTANVLAAMNTMQSNIQNSLPVIPNNGNPAGAYNMPQQGMGLGAAISGAPPIVNDTPAQKPNPWPWLQPSSFMSTLAEDLKLRSQHMQQQMQQMSSYMPQVEQQQAPVQMPMQAPMPQAANGLAQAMPQQMLQPPMMGTAVIPQAANRLEQPLLRQR